MGFAKLVLQVSVIAIMSIIMGMVLGMLWVKSGYGHDAPSGWEYDQHCCSGHDCAQIDRATVTTSATGYTVSLQPEHHHILRAPLVEHIPFGSTKIKISRDEHFHACVLHPHGGFEMGSSGPYVRCLYVPPQGF